MKIMIKKKKKKKKEPLPSMATFFNLDVLSVVFSDGFFGTIGLPKKSVGI
jgi:hypothetical protein